ncbi:MAG: DUF481 domain-containing protein [Deltaproteobacteria bacterium]|nr:DUF481 domain-containing protein [Deltaproteobacteria bacterium]MCB9489674.1 DUF481 domain-containing protein [Deltaproteobacteria bacterium]
MRFVRCFLILMFALLALPTFAAAQDDYQIGTFGEKTPESEVEKYPLWTANGSLGYNASGGYVDTNSVVGDLAVTHERRWVGHFLKGGIAYGTVTYPEGDPIVNVNNYFGNYKFEVYLAKNRKPYLWGLLGALSDEFQGFWGRYTAEAGLGYSWFGTADAVLKTEAGYAFIDTNWINRVELEDGSFHYWEPTHNGLARLIAAIPIFEKSVQFTEEATYRHNFQDDKDYSVDTATGLTFKLTDRVSFKTAFTLNYTNQPGLVDELDETGQNVTFDDDGDPATPDVNSLVETERASYGWTNAIVVTFL